MQLSWYGQSFFKIEGKNATVVLDPFTKDIGLKAPKSKADLVVVSHDFKEFDRDIDDAFLINGPGEYEVKEVYAQGFKSQDKEGKRNTIYALNFEDIRITFLGAFGEEELNEKQLEVIGNTDILLIPVGDKKVLGGKEAMHIVTQVEPKVIIPMFYKTNGLKTDLEGPDNFLKEVGIKPEKTDKLKITVKDMPAEESKLYILE